MINEQYTPPVIRQLLYNHVLYKLYTDTAIQKNSDYGSNIRKVIQAQKQIGWHHVLYGRLSMEWGHMIGQHLAIQRIPNIEMTSDWWGKIIVRMLFQLFLDVWEVRNRDGHYLNAKHESRLTRQRIMDKIMALQESDPEVRYCDRDFV